MAEVFLDGEKVDFQGSEPDSVSALWELLDGHLGQEGRVLDSMLLDGTDWSLGYEDRSYCRAEALSVSQGARIESLLVRALESGEDVSSGLALLSRKCLSQAFEQSKVEAMNLVEVVKPFLEVLGLVEMYGESHERGWANSLAQEMGLLNDAIGGWLDAVELGKSIPLSDRSALTFRPAFQAVCKLSQDSILGKVENEIGS